MTEIVDGTTTWHFDDEFLDSNWTCIWGRGCLGILDHPAPELKQGCCSVGAELDGDDAPNLSANAAMLTADNWQYFDEGHSNGFFRDERNNATRVVDGACIFLNRPGFAGGEGCALHVAAVQWNESPVDWKPSVCWQLPVKVDWHDQGNGTEVAHVRAWTRDDWNEDGDEMAWCCTQDDRRAYVGDQSVIDSLKDELTAIVGEAVYVELRKRKERS